MNSTLISPSQQTADLNLVTCTNDNVYQNEVRKLIQMHTRVWSFVIVLVRDKEGTMGYLSPISGLGWVGVIKKITPIFVSYRNYKFEHYFGSFIIGWNFVENYYIKCVCVCAKYDGLK